MAQLSDEDFGSGERVLSVDEAVARITAALSAVGGIESVPLAQADGRVLARDLIAPSPLPPFTNSAVDGYAVRSQDLPTSAERAFVLAGRLQAGGTVGPTVGPDQAVRIFTGAPMPAGADTVFMQEDVRLEGDDQVILPPGLRHGANVRTAGEDMAPGQIALPAGRRLRPQDIGAAAALGFTTLAVRRRVRVAVFSTGDEIVEPGAARGPAQLFDCNRFMLIAMLQRIGCAASDLGILPDDRAQITGILKGAAANHDLILSSGGVSVGEADHVKAAVESVGALVFWRIGIKPGRPMAMGVVGQTPFIGLPGNPVASFVTFVRVARPGIFALAGAALDQPSAMAVRAAFAHRKKAGRREYVRATLRRAEDGAWEAVKFPRQGSALLSSLVDTDGLVELSDDIVDLEPGQMVDFLTYAALL